jgi:hypothetical protein
LCLSGQGHEQGEESKREHSDERAKRFLGHVIMLRSASA